MSENTDPTVAESATAPAPTPSTEPVTAPADVPVTEEASAPAEEETYYQPNTNVDLNAPMTDTLEEKLAKRFSSVEMLKLLALPPEDYNKLAEKITPLVTEGEFTPRMAEWLETLEAGSRLLYRGNAFDAALKREGSNWRQSVRYGNDEMRIGRPRFGDGGDPTSLLTGKRAASKLAISLGLGATAQIPLWHSGIWVTMQAPSEAELLELNRRIVTEKTLLGRVTNGLVFSNMSVYLNTALINLALKCVYDTTYTDFDAEKLRQVILLPDLPSLIWGLACTIWPNGYPYEQACTASVDCQHVFKAKLNLSKLQTIDNRLMSEKQRYIMSKRASRVTKDEDLKIYREEHNFQKFGHFQLGHDENSMAGVDLRVPTLEDYIESGIEWVDSIITAADEAFGTQMTEQERNDYLISQSKASGMRQYAHWVERLTLPDEGGVIEDRRTIMQSLDMLSVDGTLQKEFFDQVGKYIDDTCISVVAVTREVCPACKKPQLDPRQQIDPKALAKHPHLVPINVGQVFFTLLGQRQSKVDLQTLN